MDDRHKMGYLGATSYVIGNIIGSGIFITPSTILRYTESVGLSLIVWVACAAIAILGKSDCEEWQSESFYDLLLHSLFVTFRTFIGDTLSLHIEGLVLSQSPKKFSLSVLVWSDRHSKLN